jgi:predicted O-methyltransferase YrrM
MRVMTHFLLWNLGLAKPETQTTQAERDCLALHVQGKRCVVEIGVWHGVTTSLLRAGMANDGFLFGIDPYPLGRLGFNAQQRIARNLVERVSNGTVRWVRLTGVEAARNHAALGIREADFVFIDGDHTREGLRSDWEGWSSLVTADGIIALHDSRPSATRGLDAESMLFTREVVLKDPRFEVVDFADTLTILRKQPTH